MNPVNSIINTWDPDIIDFKKISETAYSIIFNQSKDRFDSLCETSYTITKNGKNILAFYLTGISTFYSYVFTKRIITEMPIFSAIILVVVLVLSVAIIAKLITLIKSRQSIQKGSTPIEMLAKEVFSEDGYETICLYYSEIVRYQTKIDFIISLNEERSKEYDKILILIAVTIVLAPLSMILIL